MQFAQLNKTIKILLNVLSFVYLTGPDVVQYIQVKILVIIKAVSVKSHNIIYLSDSVIPWDTQSAFKLTAYNASSEENMVFCYFKAYVRGEDLILCSYCFKEHPAGKEDLRLYLTLHPEKNDDVLKIVYGFDGIGSVEMKNKNIIPDTYGISFYPFKADDEQGFYWCGEITIPGNICRQMFGSALKDGDLLAINLVESFPGGDYMALENRQLGSEYNPCENMQTFVVLRY